MALVKRGRPKYGARRAAIRLQLRLYSQLDGHPVRALTDAVCTCGGRTFHLCRDDAVEAVVRVCVACGRGRAIHHDATFLANAERRGYQCAGRAQLERYECPCGGDAFEIAVGVSARRPNGEMEPWLYLGRRCIDCGLTACWDDWPIESGITM
jgi:hypothetical protein